MKIISTKFEFRHGDIRSASDCFSIPWIIRTVQLDVEFLLERCCATLVSSPVKIFKGKDPCIIKNWHFISSDQDSLSPGNFAFIYNSTEWIYADGSRNCQCRAGYCNYSRPANENKSSALNVILSISYHPLEAGG